MPKQKLSKNVCLENIRWVVQKIMMWTDMNELTNMLLVLHGAWDGVVVKVWATSRTVLGSIPGGVIGFFSDIFLPTVPWPWGQLSP
jgi:hypothetical protein